METTGNKNRLFGRHLKTVQHFTFFPGIMISNSVYIYGANSTAKFCWESGFLRGVSMEPPMGTNGSKSTLVT